MSDEYVDVVKRAVAAFNAADVDAFTALATTDFEWFPSMIPIENETFVGADGIRRYFDRLASAWEHFRVLPDRFLERADCVLVIARLEGRGRTSGATVDAPLGMAFDLREGLICRVRGYLDHGEALEATGLGVEM
ncbi:MAG TPA: nuclear transport factor 2 family protein [Solirubrobacteraceae bacterium]|jgi:ketosteroid isomerase-like protein|nr:nuclear transport factor 2 family protein [Solirubrobacteraceae bacterium]